MTNQPQWQFVGGIGDVDPIAHGGGFVYIDGTGVYAPEMTWFEPGPDEEWDKIQGATKLQEYRILLENNPKAEWWYSKLSDITSFTGQTVEELQADAASADPIKRAFVYDSLIHYFGAEEFDSYPLTRTEDEAYAKYAEEMKQSRKRG